MNWERLAIIVDSPLASRFTEFYRRLKPFWDQEVLAALKRGRGNLRYAGSGRKAKTEYNKERRQTQDIEGPAGFVPEKGEPYVEMDGERYAIRAAIHQLNGYSAHSDQASLVNFVKRMRGKPSEIRIVHGDEEDKQVLRQELKMVVPGGDRGESWKLKVKEESGAGGEWVKFINNSKACKKNLEI